MDFSLLNEGASLFDQNTDQPSTPSRERPSPRQPKRRRKAGRYAPQFDVGRELHGITGVDLTRIDGIGVGGDQTVISEVGLEMTRWTTRGISPRGSACVPKIA